MKTHYPFARAYSLASTLTDSAKTYRREVDVEGSCIDWHFAQSGLFGSIDKIRERELEVANGPLTLRPVALGQNSRDEHRAWDVIHKGILAFQDLGPSGNGPAEEWTGRRNKLKDLREALRQGPAAVNRFVTGVNQGRPLPDVYPAFGDWSTKGWHGDNCGYFDALELVDWYMPIECYESEEGRESL